MKKYYYGLKGIFLMATGMILMAGVFALLPFLLIYIEKVSNASSWVNETLAMITWFVGLVWCMWFFYKGIETIKIKLK